MRTRAVAVVAWLTLALVFFLDAITPQTLVIAILLDIPIVLAALTRSRRLTAALVTAAIACDATAAILNAAHDGYHWDRIGVLDRALSILSIALVGYLSTVVQERSERVGRLAVHDARARREAALARAAAGVRASLSYDLVTRAVTREALDALGVTGSAWYPSDARDTPLLIRSADDDLTVPDDRRAPELLSLAQRAYDNEAPITVRSDETVGRFVLDRVQANVALAIPIADRSTAFGMLIVWSDDPTAFDDNLEAGARGYARIALGALSQARLFAELAERNDALSERTSVIRDLVYALSHDLRTPLAALAMTLHQARDGAYGALPQGYAEVVDASAVAIDDLQRLAETLLLVARFEAGERRPEPQPIDLAALARQIVVEFHAVAESRRITLRTIADDDGAVRADRGEVRRAIVNLTANALQHTPDGGHVDIRVTRSDRQVRVAVEDDGYGVDATLRAALFERFAAGATRAGGGTGLGLYIVRRIAEAFGGGVSYEAREPRGSRFTFTLPENIA
jgi:signal transduction histidine kinase